MSVACDVEIKEEIKEEPLNFNEENKDDQLGNQASDLPKYQTYANPIEAIYLPEKVKEEKLDEDIESEHDNSNKQTSSVVRPQLSDNYLKKMESKQIDSEKLIEEIHARPALWDSTSNEYNDKVLKKKVWEELATVFARENASFEEKKIIGILIFTHWKNIRESFYKYSKQIEKKKSGRKGSPKTNDYIYSEHLKFFKKAFDENLPFTYSDLFQEDNQYTSSESMVPSSSVHEVQRKPLKNLEKSENPQLSFCKTFLPRIQDFSVEETIDFQMEVLKIIRNIKQKRVNST